MKKVWTVLFLTIVSSCGYTPQPSDVEAMLRLISDSARKTEICLTDVAFHFPDVIIGSKYSGQGLAQLDSLVSAGLLRETEELLSEPKYGPKYLYHYKQHNQIERKTFYLTEEGLKYYRMSQKSGFFCYGKPSDIKIDEIDSIKNDQGKFILTAVFSYSVKVDPNIAWISNTWIQQEFPQASWGEKRQTAQQQFTKDKQGAIKTVLPGKLDSFYW